jgi:H+/Cl- antiporter ClcA
MALLRSRSYVGLLVIAAILGVPISAGAYGFLELVDKLQKWLFTDLPEGLGFSAEPTWWPLPMLALCGVLVALAVQYLPGRGGHSPADGFQAATGPAKPAALPGIFFAALATLGLGAVLGPEAPLIALGGGLAIVAVRLAKRDAPQQALLVLAAAGSFAAISTLLGSPLLGAFLLMEASGLGGPTLGLVLLPGLLASGIGSLIFIGLDDWTGLGTFSLTIPGVPPVGQPDLAQFGWAVGIGVAAAVVGSAIRWLGLALRPHVERRILLATPVMGLVVAGLAIAYAEGTGHPNSDVLFSGENALGPLIAGSAGYSVGALILLLLCKGIAYGVSLSSFRGGPIFPAMFLGAAGGIALSHFDSLPMIAGAAMGIGAMSVAMLRLPLTSVLLATLLLGANSLPVMPVAIVAVTVAHVAAARLQPRFGAGGSGVVPPPAAATDTAASSAGSSPASPLPSAPAPSPAGPQGGTPTGTP